ncbi:MAG: hypothetical protein AABZ32_06140 [Bacteroidota bacterium]
MKKNLLIIAMCFGLSAFSQDINKDFKENYSKGIEHYNKGVDIINTLQPNENVMRLDEYMGDAQKQFKEALPYIEKAHSINPSDKNTLTALIGIYFSLYDYEKSDKYKKELESLKK